VDNESPELIERQMEQTRESLTEKVSLLEQQVVGTIHSATSAVHETVQSVKSAVQDTVEAVSSGVKDSVDTLSGGVKEALDVQKHVREHPWAMVGGASALGFIVGVMLPKRVTLTAAMPAAAPMPFASPSVVPTARPAWLNELYELAGREVKKLAEQAIAQLSTSLQQTVEGGIPKLLERALPEVTPHNGHGDAGPQYFPTMRH